MTTDDELHLFTIAGADTVVARDAEDAWSVWSEYYGGCSEYYGGGTREDVDGDIEQLPDDKQLAIWMEDAPDPGACCDEAPPDAARSSHNGHRRGCPIGWPMKTSAEWARENGRGFLCSTEW